jgi:MFS family permease
VSDSGFRKRDLVVPVFIPSILFSAGEGAIIPVLPTAAQQLGASLPVAGFIAGLTMLGTVLFDIPAARLVRRFGERTAMLAASLIAAAALVLAMLAQNLWQLGAGALIAGAMISAFGLARHSYMAEQVPLQQRARALSLLGGMFRAGGFLGPMIGAAIVFQFGVPAVYLAGAVLCLGSTIVLFSTPKETAHRELNLQQFTALAIAKREWKKLATVGASASILAVMRTVRQVGLPLWGIFIGMHPGTVSLFIGIAGFLDLLLFYSSGQIMDRWGRRWALIPTLIGMAIAHVLLTTAHDEISFLWVAIAMSLANALGSGIILTIGADLAPADARSEFLGAYRLLVDSGSALSPVLLSLLTVAITLPGAMFAFAGVSLVGAWLGWRWLPKFNIK